MEERNENSKPANVLVPSFPNYVLTPEGKIWNKKKRRWMPERKINDYCAVVLSEKGTAEQFYIQRLVATAFVPNPNPELFDRVIHINHDKSDNRYTNLRWGTHQEACLVGRTGEKEHRKKKHKPELERA